VVQRFEDRLTGVERQQEALRQHYDRLYALNVEAIAELRTKVENLSDALVSGGRGPRPPFPRAIDIRTLDTPDEMPAMSWHQQLRRKRVTVPQATLSGVLIAALLELLRAIAEGRVSFH
jgi:hypothetical protein